MPLRRRRPIPAAATAVEIAAYKTAELMDAGLDLIDDYRAAGVVKVEFPLSGVLAVIVGDTPSFQIVLPAREEGKE